MVSRPMTVAGLTWNPVSAYTPVAMTRSWISATKAATAIFHSKAIDRYSTITIRNVIRACTALEVIVLPQLGPTNVVLMLFPLRPSWLSSELSTWRVWELVSDLVCTCQDLPCRPLRDCTTAPLTPAWVTASWISVTVCEDDAGNWNTAPPLKSTLKSRPWRNSPKMLTSRITPEIVYHLRFRPTKS